MLTLIAAHDRNRAIGRENKMPWHIPEDFAFFKNMTTGHPVLMGRKTWESLPKRPLPGRLNIVITRGRPRDEDSAVFTSIEDALEIIRLKGEGFCIGGAEIYTVLLPHADRLLITHVDLEIEGADAFFPQVDPDEWTEVRRTVLRAEGPRCEVVELNRRLSK